MRSSKEMSLISSKSAHMVIPALLTNVSSRPYSATVCSISRRHCSFSATSVGTTNTLAPDCRHCSATSSKRSAFLAAKLKLAPCLANCKANSRPIPADAPVITTTLSEKTEEFIFPPQG